MVGENPPSSTSESLIPRTMNTKTKTLTRTVSHTHDELHSFRSYLRWMCVDQSDCLSSFLSWVIFLLFAIVVPAFSHFYLSCTACDAGHSRPYNAAMQLSLSSVAAVSFFCLSHFVKKYGLRRFLFLDKLVDDSDSVRHHYTDEFNVSWVPFGFLGGLNWYSKRVLIAGNFLLEFPNWVLCFVGVNRLNWEFFLKKLFFNCVFYFSVPLFNALCGIAVSGLMID